MATRTEVVLIDDIDGSLAVENIEFALDGRTFEIDLNATNADALRSSLQQYIDVARRVPDRTRRRR